MCNDSHLGWFTSIDDHQIAPKISVKLLVEIMNMPPWGPTRPVASHLGRLPVPRGPTRRVASHLGRLPVPRGPTRRVASHLGRLPVPREPTRRAASHLGRLPVPRGPTRRVASHLGRLPVPRGPTRRVASHLGRLPVPRGPTRRVASYLGRLPISGGYPSRGRGRRDGEEGLHARKTQGRGRQFDHSPSATPRPAGATRQGASPNWGDSPSRGAHEAGSLPQ